MRNFRYFFREGVGNMLSHGFMSFAAIGVTVACLLIMGTFSLVAYNANINLQDLQKENAVVAFVDESLTDEEAQGLQSQLSGISGVADCTFVSRQEARDEYVDQYNEDDLYSDLDPTIFRHRYVMHLTDLKLMDQVVQQLDETEGIANSDTMQLLRVVDFRQIWAPVAAVFAGVGILVGVGGSLTAIRKFLRV